VRTLVWQSVSLVGASIARPKNIPARTSRDIVIYAVILLQRLLNSNSNANGHTDHGHELARRQWRSQGQAQCVQRSARDEGGNAEDIRRVPQTANNPQPAQSRLPQYNHMVGKKK